ncbi:hypothetical protein, partial [Embleya sp. NPDC055610]
MRTPACGARCREPAEVAGHRPQSHTRRNEFGAVVVRVGTNSDAHIARAAPEFGSGVELGQANPVPVPNAVL